jgi:hypothetical protein
MCGVIRDGYMYLCTVEYKHVLEARAAPFLHLPGSHSKRNRSYPRSKMILNVHANGACIPQPPTTSFSFYVSSALLLPNSLNQPFQTTTSNPNPQIHTHITSSYFTPFQLSLIITTTLLPRAHSEHHLHRVALQPPTGFIRSPVSCSRSRT